MGSAIRMEGFSPSHCAIIERKCKREVMSWGLGRKCKGNLQMKLAKNSSNMLFRIFGDFIFAGIIPSKSLKNTLPNKA
jgi:hypothetical protein